MKLQVRALFIFCFLISQLNQSIGQYDFNIFDFGESEIGHFSARISSTDFITIGYIGGFTSPTPFISRIRKDNTLVWKKPFNISGYSERVNFAITAIEDILIPGYKYNLNSASDITIISRNQNGDLLWEKEIVQGGDQYCNLIFKIQGDKYILLARHLKKNTQETDSVVLYCLNNNGDKLWTKFIIPSKIGTQVYPVSLIENPINKEIYVLWNDATDGAKWKGTLTKLDSFHNILWTKEYFSMNQSNGLFGICFSNSGSLALCGWKKRNAYIQGIDTSGIILWAREITGTNIPYFLEDIAQLPNGRLLAGGYADGLLIVELDENGDNLQDSIFKNSGILSINSWDKNDLISSGYSYTNDQNDILIISKIKSIFTSSKETDTNSDNYYIYPNPNANHIHLSEDFSEFLSKKKLVWINDINGQILFKEYLDRNSLRIYLENLSKGFYILNFEAIDQSLKTIKVLKI